MAVATTLRARSLLDSLDLVPAKENVVRDRSIHSPADGAGGRFFLFEHRDDVLVLQ